MDCQFGNRRRAAEWDEIEEAPQIKKYCEDVKSNVIQQQQPVQAQQPGMAQQQQQPTQQPVQPTAEPPKFYISAPIQGYSSDGQGGCKYVFF